MEKRTVFSSKLLLLGEHAIVIGSKGLALPYPEYSGRWVFQSPKSENDQKSNTALKHFAAYIEKIQKTESSSQIINLQRLKSSISEGLYFDSDIPMGYGLGSSGALCAALLYEFGDKNAVADLDLNQLRSLLAILESHFHGSSSGVDPLISFLDQPLLLLSKKEAEVVSLPDFSGTHGTIFLLDTGIPRQTGPLVNLFLERCQDSEYRGLIDNHLSPFNESGVLAFLLNDMPAFAEAWTAISEFQLEHFKPMIPEGFESVWQKGLDSGEYFLKLCGAGGGGYFLGFAPMKGGGVVLPSGAFGFLDC